RAVRDVERVRLDRVVAVRVDGDLLGAVRLLEGGRALLAAAVHVVEVHADLAGQVGRPVRVRVAEAAVLLVAPRTPRVPRAGERSVRAGQARPRGIGAFRRGRGERLPAAAALPGRRPGG